MGLSAWILIILTAIYVPLWILAWRTGGRNRLGLQKYGPVIKINTRFGIKLMDRLCVYHRFWRGFGTYSQIVAFFLMVAMVYVMLMAVVRLPHSLIDGEGMGIEYALAIPGLNPIMPFWYTLLALIVALVLHELAHGMQTRTNGMRVENTGLLYGVVPLGAFVEPNEEDVRKAPRRVKLDLYAAGVATNFTIAVVAFALMLGMMAGISSPYEGRAAVYGEVDGSPADIAGIPAGAVILRINGLDYEYSAGYRADYPWSPGDVVTVTYDTEDERGSTADILWGAYVSRIVDGSPAEGALREGWTLYQIDGQKMYTAAGFSEYMHETSPGQTVTVRYVDGDGVRGAVDVTLSGKDGSGYLGVYTTTAGMNFITPEMMMHTALNPLYGYDSVTEYGMGLLHYISLPFDGFAPVPDSVHWWYGDQPLGFWSIAQALYWMSWLNILLGITNALPAAPFDGGFIFQGWLDRLLEKMGKKDPGEREKIAGSATNNLSILMIFLFVLVIVAVVI